MTFGTGPARAGEVIGRTGSLLSLLFLAAPCAGEDRVWTDRSVAFLLHRRTCGAGCIDELFWTRTPSTAQREALSRLKVVPAAGDCGADGWSATLTVHDRTGVPREFSYRNRNCGSGEVLEEASYDVFEETVPDCLVDPRDGSIPRNGCLRPISSAEGMANLGVHAGETVRIMLMSCVPPARIRLLAPVGNEVLAEGTPSAEACSRIVHRSTEGDVFRVAWSMTSVTAFAGLGAEIVPPADR